MVLQQARRLTTRTGVLTSVALIRTSFVTHSESSLLTVGASHSDPETPRVACDKEGPAPDACLLWTRNVPDKTGRVNEPISRSTRNDKPGFRHHVILSLDSASTNSGTTVNARRTKTTRYFLVWKLIIVVLDRRRGLATRWSYPVGMMMIWKKKF